MEEGQLQGWLLQSWPPANITRLQSLTAPLFTGVNRGKIPFFLLSFCHAKIKANNFANFQDNFKIIFFNERCDL